MRFGVLGEVHVDRDGDAVALGGPQQRRLLALLLSERGRVVSTDRIVDALWADGEPPEAASRSAMKYVSRLRGVLGDGVIVTVGSGYRLELNGHGCDAEEFEKLIDAAGREMPDTAVARYDAALELWRGPAYGEFGEEWWALPEASRLAERRVAAEVARAAARMAMGHHNQAIPDLERLAAERPHDERPVKLLMHALQATGRQAEALRIGSAFRRRLADETGLDASADLARLETAIASGDSSPGDSPGRALRGYTIHDAVGEGTHGRVYAATQPGTERRVAIKVIRPDLADSSEFVHRFEAEARLVARLEHPHIVPLYDYWREPGGAYLVFRLLPGGTARDSVVTGGPWSLARVSRLVEEVGAALISAHGAGVAHNDVKTSNVLLDDDGAAYLSDFGIARTADNCGAGVADDIAGLGAMAWELLSGSRPPGVPSTAGAPSRADNLPSLVGRMPSAPDGLDAVLRRTVGGGYESVAEFVLAWRAAVGDPEGPRSPVPSDSRRAAARQLARAATAGVNPYRGLRPFDDADAASFYGRDSVVADLAEMVAAQRFVTVIGSSGSGKSSVVLAGLVPRLRARGAVVVAMVPGEAPVDALDTALREVATVAADGRAEASAGALADVGRRAGRLVVVVDQFEECWTRATSDQRDAFLDVVAEAVADESVDTRFVMTVRADLLDRPLEHATIGTLVGAGSYVLAPLSPAELEEAIVEPAARVGVTFDEGVVADLIAESVSYPGSLPLLQFTLTELYDRRRDARISREALERIGGMAGAIGRRAEEIFAELDAPRRADARALFGRLVVPGRSGPDTRRRAPLGELSAGMREVADTFVAARLLVADRDPASREPTVEVAHEALLTRWSRLVDWVEEDRRWLIQLQHLSAAARAWDDAGRPDTELYRGSRLEAAIEAIDIDGRVVSDLERNFLGAGRHARDADIRVARRTSRRLRRLLVAAAVALVVALVAGAVAVLQRRRADDNATAAAAQAERAEAEAAEADVQAQRADQEAERAAEQAERANAEAERASDEAQRADQEADRARAQALSASALNALNEDPSLAKLLAVASTTFADPAPETMALLRRAWAADRVTARPGPTYDLPMRAIDIDPSGLLMAVAGADAADGSGKLVDVVDLATDTTAWTFELDEASAWVVSPRFTPVDGEHLTAGVYWDPHNRNRLPPIERGGPIEEPPPDLVGVLVWDADTGGLVERHDLGRCGGFPSAISATHLLVRTLHGSPEVVAACDWRQGTLGAELVDRRTGERLLLTQNSLTHRRGAVMSADGSTVAYDDIDTARNQHDLVVADTSTGEERLRLTPAPGIGYGVRALDHDGSLLLYGDQPIEVWDVTAGRQVASIEGHQGGSGVTFSAGGRSVLSTGVDGVLREWDTETGEERWAQPGIADGPVAVTTDGRALTIGYSGSNATPAALIDLGPRGELGAVDTCRGLAAADNLEVARGLAVFPITCDGDLSATTYVVDVQSQRVLYTLPGHQAQALAVSPDGSRFVRQEAEGTMHGRLAVRDLRTGAEIVELGGLCSWDTASARAAGPQAGCAAYPEPPFGITARRLTWSPDGTMIAAAAGTAVVAWDADTGALLHAEAPDPARIAIADVRFTPDSQQLIAVSNDNMSRVISTRTWQVVSTGIGSSSVGIVGFSPDGSRTLVALQLMIHTGASLHWFDQTAQQLLLSRSDIHEGSLRSVALSSDGTLVATAASDGLVRVWDAATLDLVYDIPLGDTPLEAVAFVDDRRLAVTPQGGDLVLVTIDPDELLDLVRRSLTRGFTAAECTRFGFGDDCPTLAELSGRPAGADDPAVLNGRYQVAWADREFAAALAAAGEPRMAANRSGTPGYPDAYTGTYTVTFDDGRFDVIHNILGAYCTGSYTVTGERVRLFAERREPLLGCFPGRFLDATYVHTDDGLTFSAPTAHPVDAVLFASRSLARVEE